MEQERVIFEEVLKSAVDQKLITETQASAIRQAKRETGFKPVYLDIKEICTMLYGHGLLFPEDIAIMVAHAGRYDDHISTIVEVIERLGMLKDQTCVAALKKLLSEPELMNRASLNLLLAFPDIDDIKPENIAKLLGFTLSASAGTASSIHPAATTPNYPLLLEQAMQKYASRKTSAPVISLEVLPQQPNSLGSFKEFVAAKFRERGSVIPEAMTAMPSRDDESKTVIRFAFKSKEDGIRFAREYSLTSSPHNLERRVSSLEENPSMYGIHFTMKEFKNLASKIALEDPDAAIEYLLEDSRKSTSSCSIM